MWLLEMSETLVVMVFVLLIKPRQDNFEKLHSVFGCSVSVSPSKQSTSVTLMYIYQEIEGNTKRP